MSNYQRGYEAAQRDLALMSLSDCIELSEHFRNTMSPLSMWRIGYSTAVGVRMERVWN